MSQIQITPQTWILKLLYLKNKLQLSNLSNMFSHVFVVDLPFMHCLVHPEIIVCTGLYILSLDNALKHIWLSSSIAMNAIQVDEVRRVCIYICVLIWVLRAKLRSSANLLGLDSINDLNTLPFHSAGAQWVSLLEERNRACPVSSDSLIGSLRWFLKFLCPFERLFSCIFLCLVSTETFCVQVVIFNWNN